MNRIMLEFRTTPSTIIEAPIQEDFQIETNTEFTSFADLCGPISSLVDLANAASTTGGTVSRSGLMLRSIIDSQRWAKTNPVKINLDMFFYTKTDPKIDVIGKVNTLLKYHILWHDDNGKIHVPGISAKEIRKLEKEIEGKKPEEFQTLSETKEGDTERIMKATSSFFSVLIPGIVYLESAFMFSIKPTYSKQVTVNGYPLWASVNMEICGTAPAFVHNFEQGAKFYYSRFEGAILNESEVDIRGF